MDLENQKRVKEFVEQYGAENIVGSAGCCRGRGAGLAAETVTATPLSRSFGRSLVGTQGLSCCEPEIKAEFDEAVYEEQVGMMEMVLDVDDIVSEMTSIREQYCKCLLRLQLGGWHNAIPSLFIDKIVYNSGISDSSTHTYER